MLMERKWGEGEERINVNILVNEDKCKRVDKCNNWENWVVL